MSWESILKEHSYILSEWSNHCFFQILSLLVGPAAVLVKVSKFQNELIKSSFLPKYEPKILRISSLYCATLRPEILTIFGSYFGRNDDFIN